MKFLKPSGEMLQNSPNPLSVSVRIITVVTSLRGQQPSSDAIRNGVVLSATL
jgi:hypothetical protein